MSFVDAYMLTDGERHGQDTSKTRPRHVQDVRKAQPYRCSMLPRGARGSPEVLEAPPRCSNYRLCRTAHIRYHMRRCEHGTLHTSPIEVRFDCGIRVLYAE